MGRVGWPIELRSKHPATWTRPDQRCPVTCTIRQDDPPVVPVAGAFHQQRVNSVYSQGAHSLQNVNDGWRARTGITVVIGHIRIEAADARTMPLLNEDVATIAITADAGENHRDTLEAEMPAGRHPWGVVIHPANYYVTAQVGLSSNGFLEAKSNSSDFGRRNALPLQVLGQRQRLVPTDILCIEALAVEVARFHNVVVQECDPADTLAYQGRGDVRNKAPGPDAQHAALGEDLLIKASDLALAVFRAGNCFAAQPNRGLRDGRCLVHVFQFLPRRFQFP